MRSLILIFLSVVATRGSADQPIDFRTLDIGEEAPAFELMGIDDQTHTLADFDGTPVLVVYFTSNHCPVCHAQDPRMVEAVKGWDPAEVRVVAINPNSGDGLRADELGFSRYDDSFEDMKLYARDEGFTFPYLYDGDTQSTAKAYGCLATPHVFIFDADRRLRYKGYWDDSRFPDPETVNATAAADAVGNLIDGRRIEPAVTRPFGCSTKWLEKRPEVRAAARRWTDTPVTVDTIDADGLAELRSNPTGRYRLFNVWSTTCIPCVREFPGLVNLSRRMGLRAFELITVSTDPPDSHDDAKKFLESQHAAAPRAVLEDLKREGRSSNNLIFTDPSIDRLIESLDPEWEGPLPHTVLVAPGGEIVWRHNGAVEETVLLDAVLDAMGTGYSPD